MTGGTMIFVLPCLFFCWMPPVESKPFRHNAILRDRHHDIPLSMVDDSIDDMHSGCHSRMLNRAIKSFFESESIVSKYAKYWGSAEHCARGKLTNGRADGLTMQHLQAICVYTEHGVYSEFSNAVRTQRNQYGSSFQFHALHSLLTSAIQILQDNNYCRETYKRTKSKFTGQIGQIIRFGSFASSSYKTDLKIFGSETCFKIKTCSGAFLKNYSAIEDEAEVLIPPYEMFNITQVFSGKVKPEALKDCRVVFVLESAGVKSNLNCKLVK